VVADFRKYLESRQVATEEPAFREAEPEIRRELEREIAGAIWGLDTGIKVARESDPVVMKAIEVLPEATKLLDTVK
ncbi:MAG: hypothetical protein ACXWFO_07285, partial [Candidatus Aminicenantales bacterium]